MKDKRFVLDLMTGEFATNEESRKEGSKSKEDEYLLKKVDVQVKKVYGDPHSNIHKMPNVTTMKFTINDDAGKRRNKKKNIKLRKDVIHGRKRKAITTSTKRGENQTPKDGKSNLKI